MAAAAVAVPPKDVIKVWEITFAGLCVSTAFACGAEFPHEATVMRESLHDQAGEFVGVCVSICNGFVYRDSEGRDSADSRMCNAFRRYIMNITREGSLDRLLEPKLLEMQRMFQLITQQERTMVDTRGDWDLSDTHAAVIVTVPRDGSFLVTVCWIGNGGMLSYGETFMGSPGWRVPKQTMYVSPVIANQIDLSRTRLDEPGNVQTCISCMPNILLAPGQAFMFTTDGHLLFTVDKENCVIELNQPISGGDTATVDMMQALIDAGAKGNCTVVALFAKGTQ